MTKWVEVPISKNHDRDSFDCGDEDLNQYLRRFARQNHESGVSTAFLFVSDQDSPTILGYYTLSPASIDYDLVPESVRKRFPSYELPVYRLGRLAVDISVQGMGLGSHILLAAGRRCINVAAEAGGVAMLIDAKNDRAARWYEGFGAVPAPDNPLTLLMRLDLIAKSLRARDSGE